MSYQATFNNTENDPAILDKPLPSPEDIHWQYSTHDDTAYELRTVTEVVDNTQEVTWDLDAGSNTDYSNELLDLLAANEPDVLNAIKTHTDLRTTISGSILGHVRIDPDTGHITGFGLINAYPGEPDVQINHSALVADLKALNP